MERLLYEESTAGILRAQVRFLRRKKGICRAVLAVGLAAVLSVLAFGAVFGIALVNGSSMSPAINAGDCLLFVRRGEYRRGDIVLFCRAGDLEDEYIKRIIALPGERVDISADGIVLINGAAIDEPYASGQTIGDGSVQFPLLLGADEYFVLGDNREVSHDSRRIGAVARGSLLGRVVIVLRLSGKQN